MNFNEIPLGDEQEAGSDCMFEIGDMVDVLANKDDDYNDFCGTVVGFKNDTIQVKDQDDNVWSCGESQLQII